MIHAVLPGSRRVPVCVVQPLPPAQLADHDCLGVPLGGGIEHQLTPTAGERPEACTRGSQRAAGRWLGALVGQGVSQRAWRALSTGRERRSWQSRRPMLVRVSRRLHNGDNRRMPQGKLKCRWASIQKLTTPSNGFLKKLEMLTKDGEESERYESRLRAIGDQQTFLVEAQQRAVKSQSRIAAPGGRIGN